MLVCIVHGEAQPEVYFLHVNIWSDSGSDVTIKIFCTLSEKSCVILSDFYGELTFTKYYWKLQEFQTNVNSPSKHDKVSQYFSFRVCCLLKPKKLKCNEWNRSPMKLSKCSNTKIRHLVCDPLNELKIYCPVDKVDHTTKASEIRQCMIKRFSARIFCILERRWFHISFVHASYSCASYLMHVLSVDDVDEMGEQFRNPRTHHPTTFFDHKKVYINIRYNKKDKQGNVKCVCVCVCVRLFKYMQWRCSVYNVFDSIELCSSFTT